MISKSAVRKFFNRKLSSSEKAKRFTDRALDRKLDALSPRPVFHTEPRHSQKVAFLLCAKYDGYMPSMDMGLGKTKLMLDLFAWRKAADVSRRLLVLVPNATNVVTWGVEAATHTPQLTIAEVGEDVSGESRRDLLLGDSDAVFITYAGLLRLACTGKGDNETGWKSDPKRIREIGRAFNMIVLDESTFLRSHKSLTFRVLRQLRKYIEYLYCLTGTPHGNDVHHLWPQFYLMDRGYTLGETLGLYRAAYFIEHENPWTGGPEYEFDKRKAKQLHRRIKNRSVRYESSECVDLPECVSIKKYVTLPESTWAYHDRLVQEYRQSRGNPELLKNSYHRMRQLTSGYLAIEADGGPKIEVTFKENPRIDAVLAVLNEAPDDCKLVIFNEYTHTGDLLEKAIRAERVGMVRIYGKSTKKKQALRRFINDLDCRVMLMQSKSGSYGLNLQHANYVVFAESPVDPIVRSQAEKRCHRHGQKRKVFVVDIIVKGSVDVKIMRALAEGKSLFDLIVDGKETLDDRRRKPKRAARTRIRSH